MKEYFGIRMMKAYNKTVGQAVTEENLNIIIIYIGSSKSKSLENSLQLKNERIYVRTKTDAEYRTPWGYSQKRLKPHMISTRN